MTNIESKINYQLLLEDIIKKEKANLPTLLLHSCCGPCSSYVLEYLSFFFKITVYYYNPNIDTELEYEKRLTEQIKIINKLKVKNKVELIKSEYNPNYYLDYIKGLENEKEGSIRCHKCYKMRLEETASLASKLNFDYFCTTLTVSPYKNSAVINEIGSLLEKKYNVSYLYSDFKKKNGYKRSIELSKEYNLYRQDYCGCIFSHLTKE